jgi:hypothetical protein
MFNQNQYYHWLALTRLCLALCFLYHSTIFSVSLNLESLPLHPITTIRILVEGGYSYKLTRHPKSKILNTSALLTKARFHTFIERKRQQLIGVIEEQLPSFHLAKTIHELGLTYVSLCTNDFAE